MIAKLTTSAKKWLYELGYTSDDFNQIEKAMLKSKTKYKLISISKNNIEKTKVIDREQAISILGIHDYLSGIARSAFHFTAWRENKDQTYAVMFDSSLLFKN